MFGLMRLQVDHRAEHSGELFIYAASFVADKVIPLEVFAQRGIVLVELIGPIRVAKVAEVVLTTQVSEQFIAVQVAHVTVLAERVAAV